MLVSTVNWGPLLGRILFSAHLLLQVKTIFGPLFNVLTVTARWLDPILQIWCCNRLSYIWSVWDELLLTYLAQLWQINRLRVVLLPTHILLKHLLAKFILAHRILLRLITLYQLTVLCVMRSCIHCRGTCCALRNILGGRIFTLREWIHHQLALFSRSFLTLCHISCRLRHQLRLVQKSI